MGAKRNQYRRERKGEQIMREILFTGKRVDNGEWVFGSYVFEPRRKGGVGQTISELDRERHYIVSKKNYEFWEVIPETVGEYTGLTDKNGRKIFEGYILKVYETQEHAQNVSVSYENGQFVVSHYALKLLSDRVLQSEVIGTIYDNPELLEVEK